MLGLLEIIGALLIVAAFTLTQMGRLGATTYPSLWLNLAGSAILAAIALHRVELGFLLLEGTWAVVSTVGLVRRASGREARQRTACRPGRGSPSAGTRERRAPACPTPRARPTRPGRLR